MRLRGVFLVVVVVVDFCPTGWLLELHPEFVKG